MEKEQLKEILEKHKKWINNEEGGKRADLIGADLRGANLSEADLIGADLRGANLSEADLIGADLRGANLYGANLYGADLRGADLYGANLYGANLRGVIYDENTAMYALACPEKGAFIGYKRAGSYIVELEITADAKRSSATTRKCRCSKAKILNITNIDGSECGISEVESDRDIDFIYRVGETVEVTDFDDFRWNECSTGIRFFITRDEAVRYR